MAEDPSLPIVDELVPPPDPLAACARLEGLPYRLFLDSAATGGRLGRYSFLMADPVAVVRSKGGQTDYLDVGAGARRLVEGDVFDVIRRVLAPNAARPLPNLPPFQGGAAGYVAYDWGRLLERLPASRYDDLDLPDAVLGIYDWVIAWDHDVSRAWIVSTGLLEDRAAERGPRAAARAAQVRAHLALDPAGPTRPADRRIAVISRNPPAPSFEVENDSWDAGLGIRSSFTRRGYEDAVERVRGYIFAGDIFQANLSQRFEAPISEPPWEFYRRLRTLNAAPFAAYLELPDAVVLSASPERFLRVDTEGRVETRPIKGTRPRGWGPEHDGALGLALTESEKDRAENLMIVDLMRNDLSRVCASHSVRVTELFTLERYATVHHLVSTVVGHARPGVDALGILRAAFPAGSITGAPKVRAMEIIAELEPSQRSVYCGSIGYWSLTGALDTSVAIRTAIARGGRIYFGAGGGIVADSDPDQEYRETLDKARGMINALEARA